MLFVLSRKKYVYACLRKFTFKKVHCSLKPTRKYHSLGACRTTCNVIDLEFVCQNENCEHMEQYWTTSKKLLKNSRINYCHNTVYLLSEEFSGNALLVDYVYNYKSELYRNAKNEETKLCVLLNGSIQLDLIVANENICSVHSENDRE